MTTPPSSGPPSSGMPSASSGLVTLAEAADALDVHYMTAYRYVRTGRMHAQKRGGKWWVAPDDLAAVLVEGTGRREPSPAGVDRSKLVAPLTTRLLAGDTAGCWDLISDALAAGTSPAQVHVELIRPSLEKIGTAWRNGTISVADEHRATATAYRLLGQLGPLFRHRGRRRGTVVVGAVAGDMHAIPSAMMSDLLCDRRFEVIDLGANTPAESFLEAASEVDDLVGLGLCALLDESVPSALHVCRTLRTALPDSFLVVGGPPVHRIKTTEFAELADVVSVSAEDACDAFEQSLLGPVPEVLDGAGA